MQTAACPEAWCTQVSHVLVPLIRSSSLQTLAKAPGLSRRYKDYLCRHVPISERETIQPARLIKTKPMHLEEALQIGRFLPGPELIRFGEAGNFVEQCDRSQLLSTQQLHVSSKAAQLL